MMMCKTKTEKQIDTMPDKIRAKKLKYFIENSYGYKVTPKGNEHWLCGSVILTKWNHDTGCRDDFETWQLHDDIIAGEIFKTHHEMEDK